MPSAAALDRLATALILAGVGCAFLAWTMPIKIAMRMRNPAFVLAAPDTLH